MHPAAEDNTSNSTSSTMICDDSAKVDGQQNQQQQEVGRNNNTGSATPLHEMNPQKVQQQQHYYHHQQQQQQKRANQSPAACTSPGTTQQQKQEAWFQSSVISRTEAYIEAQVLQLTEECRLFSDQNQENDGGGNINDKQKDLALLQRHEVQTSWSMLGNGAFSEVYSVTGIRLLDDGFSDPIQRNARQGLRDAVVGSKSSLSARGGTARKEYVMKHLRRDLLQNRKKFVHAAGDLVLEAMYLSRLHHKNIIELKGCAVGGPSAYGDGRHDGFFLILERLQCTLSQKIQDWRDQSGNGGLLLRNGIPPSPPPGRQQQHSFSAMFTTGTGAAADNAAASYNSIYSSQLKDFELKLDIAHQVAEALAYLHSRDIIFRDLKPDNIGIAMPSSSASPRGMKNSNSRQSVVVKLFDFGLCRELPRAAPGENEVFHMSGVGTRRYMAPEVFLGQYYNVKADVYSWSMVLHAMLSLQRPYEMYTADLHKMLVCQEGVRPTIFQHWPSPIQSILRTGWAASSTDRPSMKLVCDRLQEMLDDIKATKEYEAACAAQQQSGTESPPIAVDVSGSVTTSSIQEEEEDSPSYDTIASFIESWTNSLCARSSQTVDDDARDEAVPKNPQKKNLLRTLEAHLVADTAAGGQLMMRNSQSAYNGANRWAAPDRDYQNQFARHLRSSYL